MDAPLRAHAPKQSQPQPEATLRTNSHTRHAPENQVATDAPHASAAGVASRPGSAVPTRFAHDFSQIPLHSKTPVSLQTKLTVNSPGDVYEQEADRIAEKVAGMPPPPLQRACARGGGCPKRRDEQAAPVRSQTKRVQSNDSGESAAPTIVRAALRSPGSSLDAPTREFMEPRFGHDFSRVRVHTDARAAESALALNARAYTVGEDVVFGAGQYAPGTAAGRLLLAHELAHTVQQGRGETIHRKLNIGGKHEYVPGQSSEKLKGFTQLAVGALNEINEGVTGSDGPTFIKNLTGPSAVYDVVIVESAEFNPEANKLTDNAGDFSAGGTLKWNPHMGLTLEDPFVEKPGNVELPAGDTVKTVAPSTAAPEKKNYNMSPIRVLLHELDHADRANFLRPLIVNLLEPAITDKFKGLNQEQASYLKEKFSHYKVEMGWDRAEDIRAEILREIVNEYNSEKREEGRVMRGSETRSGGKMKEGTRTHYDTGVTGVYKSKGLKSTEEGVPTSAEKTLIEEENERIKLMNAATKEAQLEEEMRRMNEK